MGTKHIVPRAEGQGGIGTATLGWGELFITNTTADSSTQGGKLTLTSNDGNAMQSGSRLGVIEFKGAESSSALTIGARIEAICDAAWTATENGASLKFYTTDANASESLVLTLDSNKLAVFTGAVAINGDLTVNGTQTTVNSQTVTIDDPVFTLGGDTDHTSDDNKDRGIEFRYYSGSAKLGFFGWDDSASAFTFIADASNSGETFSGSSGNVIFGNITGTLQTAAQTNITSVGALDGGTITSGFGAINNGASTITTTGLISGGSLDIDNVLINGTTIGHTDDTDLMTLSSGVLTVAGELDAVSLDISGDADIDGTLNVTETLTVDKTATSAIEIAKFKVSGTGGSSGNESFVSILPGSNNFTTQLRLNTNNTGNNFQTVSNKSGVLELATTDSNPIVFKTNDSTRLTISNAGVFTFTNNIIIPDSETIGCASDTDLLTLASASLTVAGKSDITTSVSGFASTITNNKDDSQGLLVRTSDNDGGEYILDLQSSSSATGTNYASKFKVAKGGDATFSGKISSVKELININSANGSRSLGLESDATGNVWIGTGTTAATINLVTGNSTNGLPSTNGVKRLCINREGTDVYASYSGSTFPFRVGYLDGSSTYTPTFVIEDNGKVGIGTTSPSELLEVKASSSPAIQINQNDQYKGIIRLGGNDLEIRGSSGTLEFYNGSADGDSSTLRMSISSGGNVGIAKSPSTYRLDLETTSGGNGLKITRGTADFQVFQAANGASYVGTGNADTLHLITGGSSKMSIASNGAATFSNYIDTPEVRQGGEFMIGRSSNIIRMGSGDASDSLAFYAGGSQSLTISSDGLVTMTRTSRNLLFNPDYAGAHTYAQIQTHSGLGLKFATNGNNDRLTISSGGAVSIGNTNPSARFHTSRTDAGTTIMADSSSGAGSGIITFFSSMSSTSNNTNCSHFKGTTQGVNSWHLHGNGSSTWSSDSRLKKDIETTRDGYIDDIKQLRVVKYKWKNDPNSALELGLIAQEVEAIFPSLVVDHKNAIGDEILYDKEDEIPNGKKVGDVKVEGTTYKGVKYSVLPMILLKAIQEQQTIIEDLKSRIKTLEG